MSYVTVFEITHQALPLWIPLFVPIFGLIFTIILLGSRGLGCIRFVYRSFALLFACLWLVFTVCSVLSQKKDIEAFQKGGYAVVEGPVEHYSWSGKTECFSVRGVEFCHGTANQVGWDPPFRLGPATWPVGVAFEGLPVRVAYSRHDGFSTILRLEVGRFSR